MKINKKIIYVFIAILVIIVLILLVFKYSKKQYSIKYTINKYNIEEHYKGNYYIIKAKKGKNIFVYTIDTNKKHKKIISKIKTINKNDLTCIIPTYKKNINSEAQCILDKKQVSTSYLIQNNNPDFQEIKDKLKDSITDIESDKKINTYKKIKLNKNNFENEKLILWDYKGIYILGKDNSKYQKILKKDIYDNIMNVVIKNYYVLFDNSSVNGIKDIYYYDLSKDKLRSFKLKDKISKKTYINGILDDKIYLTDKENKKEYTLDIKHEKLTEIDKNQTEYIIYEKGKQKILSKSDFFMNEQYFDGKTTNNVITNYDSIKENERYYYYSSDNNYYRSIKGFEEYPTLLFHLTDVKEWTLKNDKIYLISKDKILSYNIKNSLKELVQYNELRYNYKNIYNIWEN